MVLVRDAPVEVDLDALSMAPPDMDEVRRLFDFLEFRTLGDRLAEALEAVNAGSFTATSGEVLEPEVQHAESVDGALAMSTMRFADEVVPSSDVEGIPDRRSKAKPKELDLARQIIESLSTGWTPESYHDTYTEELRGLITKRSKRGGAEPPEAEAEPEQQAEVVDLMAALEASVKGARGRKGSRSRSTRKSTRSSSGPDSLPRYRRLAEAAQMQSLASAGAHGHGLAANTS